MCVLMGDFKDESCRWVGSIVFMVHRRRTCRRPETGMEVQTVKKKLRKSPLSISKKNFEGRNGEEKRGRGCGKILIDGGRKEFLIFIGGITCKKSWSKELVKKLDRKNLQKKPKHANRSKLSVKTRGVPSPSRICKWCWWEVCDGDWRGEWGKRWLEGSMEKMKSCVLFMCVSVCRGGATI